MGQMGGMFRSAGILEVYGGLGEEDLRSWTPDYGYRIGPGFRVSPTLNPDFLGHLGPNDPG